MKTAMTRNDSSNRKPVPAVKEQSKDGHSRRNAASQDRRDSPLDSAPSNHTPLLFVISAPSGGGKTTLCQELLAARKDITRAITCTTRPPRPGEKDGVDY